MKQALNPIIKFFLALCMACLLRIQWVYAYDIRDAVFAGRFYPSNSSDLSQTIDILTSRETI